MMPAVLLTVICDRKRGNNLNMRKRTVALWTGEWLLVSMSGRGARQRLLPQQEVDLDA